jgi:hypothetical protein
MLRLALVAALQCVPGGTMVLAGTLCSSWVTINSGTSGRTFLNPMGNLQQQSVRYGNAMVSRMLRYRIIHDHSPQNFFAVIISYEGYHSSCDYGSECSSLVWGALGSRSLIHMVIIKM